MLPKNLISNGTKMKVDPELPMDEEGIKVKYGNSKEDIEVEIENKIHAVKIKKTNILYVSQQVWDVFMKNKKTT